MRQEIKDRLPVGFALALFILAYLGGRYVFTHSRFTVWHEIIIGVLILTCVVLMWEMLLAHPPEGDFPEA